jgi:pectate lyase
MAPETPTQPAGRSARRQRALLAAGSAAALSAAAALFLAPAASAATLFSDSFESGLASTWSKSGGTWGLATDGSSVLQQSNAGSDLAREFNGSTSWTDYTLQARVKPLSFAATGTYVGIAARASSPTTFYRLVLLSGNQAQLQVDKGGAVSAIGTAALTVSTGTWYTLRIDVSGSTVTGFVNGTQVGSGTSTVSPTGRIGLQTFQASANFDDVAVTSVGAAPSSPPPATGGGTTPPTSPSPTGGGGGGTTPAGIEGYAAISGNGHGPTTGGSGGTTVTVTSLAALQTEAAKTTTETIMVNGLFSGSGEVTVAANKSIVGVGATSGLTGIGLKMKGVSNVVIRNMNISFVTASSGDGDAIHVETSDHIWIDHNNLFSDMTHDKDFYDGLIDLSHAADFITVSWTVLHDHWKASLVGHSDNNGSEDTGHLRVTYSHDYFHNFNSRTPSLRFGTGHVYNCYFVNGDTGVHSRENAQMLVQNNVFVNVSTPIETTGDSDVDGFVNQSGNDFGGGTNAITQTGSFTTPPYTFHLDAMSTVASAVPTGAGTGKI